MKSLRLAAFYNHLVTSDWRAWDTKSKTVPVRLFNGSYEERQLTMLGSQVKQKIVKQIEASVKTLATLKSKGKKVGALRPVRNFTALQFVQAGTTWKLHENKVKLQGFPGWYRVRGLRQLDGLELASAKLVQKPSGYYLNVTGFRTPEERETNGRKIGLDFGIKTHITTVQHSVLGRVKQKLVASPRTTLVGRFEPTTQYCPACGARNKLALSEREYVCACGYAEQRDVHAARNVLLFAEKVLLPGEPGVAPVEREISSSSKIASKSVRVEAGNKPLKKPVA